MTLNSLLWEVSCDSGWCMSVLWLQKHGLQEDVGVPVLDVGPPPPRRGPWNDEGSGGRLHGCHLLQGFQNNSQIIHLHCILYKFKLISEKKIRKILAPCDPDMFILRPSARMERCLWVTALVWQTDTASATWQRRAGRRNTQTPAHLDTVLASPIS